MTTKFGQPSQLNLAEVGACAVRTLSDQKYDIQYVSTADVFPYVRRERASLYLIITIHFINFYKPEALIKDFGEKLREHEKCIQNFLPRTKPMGPTQ